MFLAARLITKLGTAGPDEGGEITPKEQGVAHTSSTFQQKPGEHSWVGFGGISKTALTCRALSQDMGFNSLARTAENRANSLLGIRHSPVQKWN